MMIPQAPGTPGDATPITDNVVGLMTNGVLLDTHKQTWSYDQCNGHSDKKHQYHYHIPPVCFLKVSSYLLFLPCCKGMSFLLHSNALLFPQSMGVTVPDSESWWVKDDDAGEKVVRPYDEMSTQWPSMGSSPVVGFARDGYPIYALYDSEGKLQRSNLFGGDLDECNGKESNGSYAYYLTAEPPFVPTCLRGTIGTFTYAATGIGKLFLVIVYLL